MGYRNCSVVIPVKNEPAEAVQDLVYTVLADMSVSDVWVITAGPGIDVTVSRTSERFRVRQQPGAGKADALNYGLSQAHGEYVFFIDSDVVLKGDEIWRTVAILEGADGNDPVDFASCGYGSRPPAFPIISSYGGWFAACRANALRSIGGWQSDFVEDVVTTQAIKKAGYKIAMLPFAVSLRRAPRNPGLKFLSVLTSFGKHR